MFYGDVINKAESSNRTHLNLKNPLKNLIRKGYDLATTMHGWLFDANWLYQKNRRADGAKLVDSISN